MLTYYQGVRQSFWCSIVVDYATFLVALLVLWFPIMKTNQYLRTFALRCLSLCYSACYCALLYLYHQLLISYYLSFPSFQVYLSRDWCFCFGRCVILISVYLLLFCVCFRINKCSMCDIELYVTSLRHFFVAIESNVRSWHTTHLILYYALDRY